MLRRVQPTDPVAWQLFGVEERSEQLLDSLDAAVNATMHKSEETAQEQAEESGDVSEQGFCCLVTHAHTSCSFLL